MHALVPDEVGYISTFNNVYTLPIGTAAQTGSGWITAPTLFLWLAYLPAKILNLFGVPDYLSVRILSILLTTMSLYLLLEILKNTQQFVGKISKSVVPAVFFIPSIFLWTSVGLRESFIIAEIAMFLAGVNCLILEMNKRGMVYLFLGSYGLASTKNYLWAVLMIALFLTLFILFIRRIRCHQIIKFASAGFLIPLLVFAATTSAYALDYMFNSNISEIGSRSGDSIIQVYIEVPDSGTGLDTNSTKELITFHGDYTLIALRLYLTENPNSLFTKILKATHLDREIETIWDKKIALGLVSKDKQVGTDTSSLNGHILEPGNIRKPLSLIWPAFLFLCGPFPFVGDPGIAVFVSSLESPFWWALYALVMSQFIRFRKAKFLQDTQILLTLIFLAGEVAFSALVEVNLGTSFRHRSIILVPLVFLYVRLAQRASEQKEKELETI
jgi:hypothetical protein